MCCDIEMVPCPDIRVRQMKVSSNKTNAYTQTLLLILIYRRVKKSTVKLMPILVTLIEPFVHYSSLTSSLTGTRHL